MKKITKITLLIIAAILFWSTSGWALRSEEINIGAQIVVVQLPDEVIELSSLHSHYYTYSENIYSKVFFIPMEEKTRFNNPYMRFYELVFKNMKPYILFEWEFGNIYGWLYNKDDIPERVSNAEAQEIERELFYIKYPEERPRMKKDANSLMEIPQLKIFLKSNVK